MCGQEASGSAAQSCDSDLACCCCPQGWRTTGSVEENNTVSYQSDSDFWKLFANHSDTCKNNFKNLTQKKDKKGKPVFVIKFLKTCVRF